MDVQLLAAFAGVAVLLITAPGPDSLLVLRNGTAGGRRCGFITGLGTAGGILVHASAAVIGLSALLTASAFAFTVVKLAGAIYLVWLGFQSLRSAWRGPASGDHIAPVTTGARPHVRPGRAFGQGILTNVLNPKVAVFFLTFLPQFVDPAAGDTRLQLALLGTTFCAMALLWLTAIALGAGAAAGFLNRPRVRRTMDATTGTVFLAFGARLAVAHR